MKKVIVSYRIVIISFLALGFALSLVANVYFYHSLKNKKIEHFSYQQYNEVLTYYEQLILSTSEFIHSKLDSSINTGKISGEDLLDLYTNYESLNRNQIQYANYVQAYTSPKGKKAFNQEVDNELNQLNYVPGFVYFNTSIALFKKLILENNYNDEIIITPDLEVKLLISIKIIRMNTSIYEKYLINQDFDPLSKESISNRIKLQYELTTSAKKLTELDMELSRL